MGKASSEEVAMAAEMFCALVPLAESLTASCAKHVESNCAAFQCTGHMEGRALSAFSRRRKTEETIPSARKLFLYHEASRGETMRLNARKPINVCAQADWKLERERGRTQTRNGLIRKLPRGDQWGRR